uniref:uncharacterized protein LOC112436579 n=1 Tax=Maylandia zebra TaxID=106582 RepID=UPI000D300300|nr:uncharacterized protein LOC112436579 [Maylandia zebra]
MNPNECYGSPEAIENAPLDRLDCFPKISYKDPQLLRELQDLLLEIDAAKSESYIPGLLYLDTARGINPVVEKLPYAMQEKWMNCGSKYKEDHRVSFPPFSAFVAFIGAEFLQITTKPLQAKFLAQLDNLTDKLMQNFQGSKGAKGQKIKDIMAISSLYDDIDIKREHTLKSLVIYFNEDPDLLFKEYLTSSTEDERLRSTAATVTVFTPSEEKGFRSQRMLELSLKVLQL